MRSTREADPYRRYPLCPVIRLSIRCMQKWQYTVRYATGQNAMIELTKKADELGQEGWEMVSHTLQELQGVGGGARASAFFKRPLL